MPSRTTLLRVPALLLAGILLSAACVRQAPTSTKRAPAEPQEGRASSAHGGNQAEITAPMREVLAKADLVDGTTDKTVTRCAACALAMDGTKEHSLEVGEYTLLFCAEDCKTSFAADTGKSVLAMKVPASK